MSIEPKELNSYVRHTLSVLEVEGVCAETLLEGMGIDRAALDGQEDQLTQAQYSQLLDRVTAVYPEQGLGLLDGQGVTLLDHGLLGYAMFASRDLGRAIERHTKYQDVIGAALQTALFTEGERACLRVVRIVRSDLVNTSPKLRYETERLLAQWAEIGPALGQSKHWYDRVDISYPMPACEETYRRVLGDQLFFGRDYTQLVFDAALLDMPFTFANEQAAALCEQQCAALLGQLKTEQGYAGRIRRLLANAPGLYPSIEEAASHLALSERSLRRRLADEGTTYKQVVLDFRMELAASYLRGQELTIQEVAYLAGYADASNFHRSFSTYFGKTPGSFREAHATAVA